MAEEVQAPPSVLTPEYKKTRPGAMFAFAVGTMSDSMEGGLINTLFPVISKALSLDVGALGNAVQHEQVGPYDLRHPVSDRR